MRKIFCLMLILSLSIFLISCQETKEAFEDPDKRIDLYYKTIQDLMDYHTHIDETPKNIGLYFETGIDEDERDILYKKLEETYSLPVIDYTMEQKSDDVSGPNHNKVLFLIILIVEVKNDSIKIECQKVGTEYGAAGYTAYYQYKDGTWVLIKMEYEWLS